MAFQFCPLRPLQGQQTTETPIKLTGVLRNRKMIFLWHLLLRRIHSVKKTIPPPEECNLLWVSLWHFVLSRITLTRATSPPGT